MIRNLKITVLVDNYVASTELLGEFGLSLLIEADGRRLLFDTGQSGLALRNAATLGISLAGLDAVVLSHGHNDHTGGLADVLTAFPPARICLHPAALDAKYARRGTQPHEPIGIPSASLQAVEALRDRIVWTSSATEIIPGIWCTGEISRAAGNAQSIDGFFRDAACHVPDTLPDDQALFIETTRGRVVIAGCAHSGLVNTLDHIRALRGSGDVYALMGGFHLGRAPEPALEAAAAAIRRANCRMLAPCHCTGLAAQSYLRSRFHSLVCDMGTGIEIALGDGEAPQ